MTKKTKHEDSVVHWSEISFEQEDDRPTIDFSKIKIAETPEEKERIRQEIEQIKADLSRDVLQRESY